jgi:hypothetical protein
MICDPCFFMGVKIVFSTEWQMPIPLIAVKAGLNSIAAIRKAHPPDLTFTGPFGKSLSIRQSIAS